MVNKIAENFDSKGGKKEGGRGAFNHGINIKIPKTKKKNGDKNKNMVR